MFTAHSITRQTKSTLPLISITKNGTLNFNRAFTKDHNLYKGQHVVLFYDKDTNQVAIHFSDNRIEGCSYKLQMAKFGCFIGASSFIKSNNISPSKFVNFSTDVIPFNDEDVDVLVIQL